jgi:hypothetical protein
LLRRLWSWRLFSVWDNQLGGEIQSARADLSRREAAMARAQQVLDLLTANDRQGITLTATPAKP